jgi:hypothetical protein
MAYGGRCRRPCGDGSVERAGAKLDGGEIYTRQRLAAEPVLLARAGACVIQADGAFQFRGSILAGPPDLGKRGTSEEGRLR